MATERAPRAGRVTVRRFASAAEADGHDLEYWMQVPEAERILHVWRLSQELWRLHTHLHDDLHDDLPDDLPDESGLSRSIARIRRR